MAETKKTGEIDMNSAPHGTIQPEPLVGESIFQLFITQLEDILDKFNRAVNISANMTGVERSRLFGAQR
jgi:hypothetical protein